MIKEENQIKIKKLENDEPRFLGEKLKRTIERIFHESSVNEKISTVHRFFEISMLNFSNLEEKIIKQIILPKKSGGKKQKKVW